jgi:glyceraldehyde 3-phosphate dehydrogenase
MHLLKYDSVFRKFQASLQAEKDGFTVDGESVKVLSIREPGEIPWRDMGIDIVVE